jgi:hypothetical protein
VAIVSTCALCLNERQLRQSHIIPEFLFRPLYDEKHRAQAMSTSKDAPTTFLQRGIREELLCAECENRLSVYENYWRQIFFGSDRVRIGRINRFVGLDYTRLKLFQLSILWRAGISELPPYQEVELGNHAEELRRMILEGRPGRAWEYPCVVSFLVHENEPVMGLIIQPKQKQVDGHTYYLMAAGGQLWHFFVSSHAPAPMEWVLQEDGSINMRSDEFEGLPFIRQLACDLGIAGKLPSQQSS